MSALINCFARVYRALLYMYPREFRLEYGGEMERVFRDQCIDAARANESYEDGPPGCGERQGLDCSQRA